MRSLRALRVTAVFCLCTLASLGLSACGSKGTASGPTTTAGGLAAPSTTKATTVPPSTTRAPTTASATTTAKTTAPRTTTVRTATPTPANGTGSVATARADASIKALTSYLGSGGVSIEAVDSHTGATFRYGATGGMRTGSIVKLYILETLLLQDQNRGTTLTSSQRALATRMIENSDNDAATALWDLIGGGPALTRAAAVLGVHNTIPGPGGYWGLTQTCASDYIALLTNLTQARALSAASRDYVRDLMSDVESDQSWGVSAAADPHTTFDIKNGWLGTQTDHGRWLVNSVGIITVDKQQVLIAVMTQHGRDFDSGISLVQKLAKIVAPVVAG